MQAHQMIETAATTTIDLRGVGKSYAVADRTVHALRGVDLQVNGGEFVAIVGRSGCGKSTLLNLLGGLDRPTEGEMMVGGARLNEFSEAQFTRYRRETVGIIFQFFNLLPLLSVLENTALPALLAGKPRREVLQRAQTLLERVGLGERLHQQASLLSGGEMQRVAVSRALINNPQLILADEPTGNLDSKTGSDILNLLRQAVSEQGVTLLLVTHDPHVAGFADRIVHMLDGRIQSIEVRTSINNQLNNDQLPSVQVSP